MAPKTTIDMRMYTCMVVEGAHRMLALCPAAPSAKKSWSLPEQPNPRSTLAPGALNPECRTLPTGTCARSTRNPSTRGSGPSTPPGCRRLGRTRARSYEDTTGEEGNQSCQPWMGGHFDFCGRRPKHPSNRSERDVREWGEVVWCDRTNTLTSGP